MRTAKPKPKPKPPEPQGFPLTQLLQDKGISKRQLAKKSGIPFPMLCRLSLPESNPTWQTVLRIVEALDLTVNFRNGRRPA